MQIGTKNMGNGKGQGHVLDIAVALNEASPKTLLVLGPHMAEVFTDYVRENPSAKLMYFPDGDLEQAGVTGHFDFVFISGVLEFMPKPLASALLARLRDVHAQQLFALVPIGKAWLKHASLWEINDMLGFGMERVNVYASNGLPVALLKFDVRTYKTTPEWFNSKYWARPDLWNKY